MHQQPQCWSPKELLFAFLLLLTTLLISSSSSLIKANVVEELKQLDTSQVFSQNGGDLGSVNTLNPMDYVNIQLPTIRANVKIIPYADTYLVGNFTLNAASNIKEGYTLPSGVKRTPLTAVAFLSLDLSNVNTNFPENRTIVFLKRRLQLSLSYISWIPTFFNMDPTSFLIYFYDESKNSFLKPSVTSVDDYGASIVIEEAYNKTITIGVFVYNEVETIKLGRDVSIYYPRSVMYSSISTGITNIAYSFPFAEYKTQSTFGTYFIFNTYSYSSTIIPISYATLGRFTYLKVDQQVLNMTSAYVSIQFKTDTNYYFNIDTQNIVEVDLSTIGCYYYIGKVLKSPISKNVNNGILTCYLNSANDADYELFIVAKLKNTPPPPTPPTPPPTPPNPKPDPNPTPDPVIPTVFENIPQSIYLAKYEEKVYKILIPVNTIATFTSTFTLNSRLNFYVEKSIIPTSSRYSHTLKDGKGSITNSLSTEYYYILIVNSDSSSIDFTFNAKFEDLSVPEPNPTSSPSNSTYIYIIVGVIISIVLAFIVGVIIFVVFITRRRRVRNIKDPYLNATLMQQQQSINQYPTQYVAQRY